MGIRYYSYPVRADLIEAAKTSPQSFLGDDPFWDAWGSKDEQPPMLYLDKCWHELQMLLRRDGDSPKRPAFRLVEGQVTQTSDGWISYTAVLDPRQVAEISKDLATVTPEEVRASVMSGHTLGSDRDLEKDVEYVIHYLREALLFTTALSESGNGLVYTIG